MVERLLEQHPTKTYIINNLRSVSILARVVLSSPEHKLQRCFYSQERNNKAEGEKVKNKKLA
jgi:hypothetical protein